MRFFVCFYLLQLFNRLLLQFIDLKLDFLFLSLISNLYFLGSLQFLLVQKFTHLLHVFEEPVI